MLHIIATSVIRASVLEAVWLPPNGTQPSETLCNSQFRSIKKTVKPRKASDARLDQQSYCNEKMRW